MRRERAGCLRSRRRSTVARENNRRKSVAQTLPRCGGIINIGGLKVHSGEIEAVINRHPQVRMSLVRPKRSPIIDDRYNVKVMRTREALFEFCEHAKFDEPPQMLLQEYIPGDDWIYHGYCNSKMNLYVSFTGKKLLDYPPGAGATALGVSSRNEALRSQSEGVLRAISYSGISDIDWREDERDGQYRIIDCNPRIGMNFRMFESSAAIDVVRAQHLNLTGRSVDGAQMIEGRRFIVEPYCLVSSIRGGRVALPTEAGQRPSVGSRELAWWSSDDVLPFLVMSVRLMVQTIWRALRHTWNYWARQRHEGSSPVV